LPARASYARTIHTRGVAARGSSVAVALLFHLLVCCSFFPQAVEKGVLSAEVSVDDNKKAPAPNPNDDDDGVPVPPLIAAAMSVAAAATAALPPAKGVTTTVAVAASVAASAPIAVAAERAPIGGAHCGDMSLLNCDLLVAAQRAPPSPVEGDALDMEVNP